MLHTSTPPKAKPRNYPILFPSVVWSLDPVCKLTEIRLRIESIQFNNRISENGHAGFFIECLDQLLHPNRENRLECMQLLYNAIQHRGLDINGYYNKMHFALATRMRATRWIWQHPDLDFSLPVKIYSETSLFEWFVLRWPHNWRVHEWIPTHLYTLRVIRRIMFKADIECLFDRFEPLCTGNLWYHSHSMVLQTMQTHRWSHPRYASSEIAHLVSNINAIYSRISLIRSAIYKLNGVVKQLFPNVIEILIREYLWKMDPDEIFNIFMSEKEKAVIVTTMRAKAIALDMTLQVHENPFRLKLKVSRCCAIS